MLHLLCRSLVRLHEARRRTAFHEGGHVLVALSTDGADPVHKATIVPRGHALGYVAQVCAMLNINAEIPLQSREARCLCNAAIIAMQRSIAQMPGPQLDSFELCSGWLEHLKHASGIACAALQACLHCDEHNAAGGYQVMYPL